MITLVAAMGRGRVIGANGQMPWHLPAEMKHFRRVTKGQVVVMGRKTFESIGEPLKGRVNMVMTRDQSYEAPGCLVVHSIDEAMRDDRPLFVIGGAELYRAFLPYADTMILTRIHHDFHGDTFFPAWDEAEWLLTTSEAHPQDDRNAYDFTIETYQRNRT